MPVPVYIPDQFTSQYSLLNTFARELGEAFSVAGASVNPSQRVADRAIFLMFNSPENLATVRSWIESRVDSLENAAVLHFHVDHPFALHAPHIDELVRWPHYRLLLPCRDDAHVLRLRWPGLKHMTCEHGVPPRALCNPQTLRAEHMDDASVRDLPLLAAGSIHSEAELEQALEALPQPLRPVASGAGELLASNPSLTFTQAFDYVLPAGMVSPDHWRMLSAVWRIAIARANTLRRVRIVAGMQGLPLAVCGPGAWEPHCTGTIRYLGEVAYSDLPATLARARVSLCWGPTQFAHTFSERLLLSLGAGCATISDERLIARAYFAGDNSCAAFANFGDPAAVRETAEEVLNDPEVCAELGRRGREAVEQGHLWAHRVPRFIAAAGDCWV
jgi:hypothetical protein